MILITSIINILIIRYFLNSYFKYPFSWLFFSGLCYSLMLLGGSTLLWLFDSVTPYKMPLNNLNYAYADALTGLLLASASAIALRKIFSPHTKKASIPSIFPAKSLNLPLLFLAIISLSCMAIFIGVNGLSLGENEYSYRYDVSRGWGAVILFFPAFMPLAFYKIISSKNSRKFLIFSISSVIVGTLTFITLSGYRQILIGTILISVSVGIHKGHIKRWHLIPGLLLSLALLVILSFVRYANDTGNFTNLWISAFYYLQGDVFPMDAPLKIQEYYSRYSAAPPGSSVVLNHIGKIIPRFIWTDKPQILLDAAGFYTQEISQYLRQITLSPTILGEGYLVGGRLAFYLIAISTGLTLSLIDITSSQNKIFFIFSGAFQYAGFFLIREGFSELLLRLFFLFIFLTLYKAIYKLIYFR